MQDTNIEGKLTVKSVAWLLLYVFFLRFLIPEVLSYFVSLPQYAVNIAVQVFAIAVPCLVYLLLFSKNAKATLKLNKISWSVGIVCVIIGVSAQAISSLLNVPILLIMERLGIAAPVGSIATAQSVTELFAGILVVGLIPAVFEELLMRGIVLTATEDRGYKASLFIGAIYFAILHTRIDNILGLMFLGMVLCYVVWMTQSVFAGMIVHFSFNAYAMILDYLVGKNSGNTLIASVWFQIMLVVLSILIFGIFIGTINRKRVKRNRTKSLAKEIFVSLFNIPMVLIILGYIMFEFIRLSSV